MSEFNEKPHTTTYDPPECPSEPLLRHLLNAVKKLPREALPGGKGHLTLSILFSPARIAKVLYPWAHLDEPRAIGSGARLFPEQTVKTWEEMIFFHAEWRRDDENQDDAKMIFAIEAYNYTLPEQASAVFYLSKLDTSGWGPRLQNRRVQRHLVKLAIEAAPSDPSSSIPNANVALAYSGAASITGYLTIHFLSYFLSLRHVPRIPVHCLRPRHLSLHILARAQAAYLFPNSPENPAKMPLSDAKLIVWWREALSQVVQLVRSQRRTDRIDAYYMIPGLDKLESHPLVPVPPVGNAAEEGALTRTKWVYGHPYTKVSTGASSEAELPPLPLHLDPTASRRSRGIATLLPRFEDDPQSRFLDELAVEGQEIGKFSDLLRPVESDMQVKAHSAGATRVDVVDSQATHSGEVGAVASDSQTTLVASSSQVEVAVEVETEASTIITDASVARRTPKKPRLATLERLDSESPRTSDVPLPRRSPRNLSLAKPVGASLSSPLRSPRKGVRAAFKTPTSPPSRNKSAREGPRLTQVQLDALRSRLSLDSVSPDEFWIRMGFRQECSSGNLVGAFFIGVTAATVQPTLERQDTVGSEGDWIPPQVRPTHTIPVREMQKMVRNCLQLDDCWWNKHRESIELTQEFDEERGRLLAHVGRLDPATEEIWCGEDAWKNGRGVVWDSVPLEGFSIEEVQQAAKTAQEEAEAEKARQAQTSGRPITMLTVKRKRT